MKMTSVMAVMTLAVVCLTAHVSATIRCERLDVTIGKRNLHCCFNALCCQDHETMCRKVELSEGRMEIIPVETSFIECAIIQKSDKVCCDNLTSACNCPDGYVMCKEEDLNK